MTTAELNEYVVSPSGLARLQNRIAALETKLREIGMSKGEASEVGGNTWHDNFSFEQLTRDELMWSDHLARERRILSRARIMNTPPPADGVVHIGCAVQLRRADGFLVEYVLVCFGDGDPVKRWVDYASPLGRTLLRLEAGDEVDLFIDGRHETLTVASVRIVWPCHG
jgi:transcription elongation GreA/GreB family factor